MDQFRQSYLLPVARLLYPDCVGGGGGGGGGGERLDSQRAFTVNYSMDNDISLSYHYDNAEVTLNVCLGRSFAGGKLYFGSMRTVTL